MKVTDRLQGSNIQSEDLPAHRPIVSSSTVAQRCSQRRSRDVEKAIIVSEPSLKGSMILFVDLELTCALKSDTRLHL